MRRPVNDDTAMEVIAQFFGVDPADEKAMTTKSVLNLIGRWDAISDELGRNAYALYNAFTEYVTHKTYKAETAATGMLFNQNRLERVLESSEVFA